MKVTILLLMFLSGCIEKERIVYYKNLGKLKAIHCYSSQAQVTDHCTENYGFLSKDDSGQLLGNKKVVACAEYDTQTIFSWGYWCRVFQHEAAHLDRGPGTEKEVDKEVNSN